MKVFITLHLRVKSASSCSGQQNWHTIVVVGLNLVSTKYYMAMQADLLVQESIL